MWEMDRTMAKCPVNLYGISATDLGNSQSHKTYIFACNLIKTLMAKICFHRWTMIAFMLALCGHCKANLPTFPTTSMQDPPFEGAHPTWGLCWLCWWGRRRWHVHLHNNNDSFGNTHMHTPKLPLFLNKMLFQLLFSLVLGFFFQCTGYAKSISNDQGVLYPILAHLWWTGCLQTCSGIHGTVTESVPYGLLFISLCLPFLSCSMSVIIQAIFHEWFYKSFSISRLIIPCCKG